MSVNATCENAKVWSISRALPRVEKPHESSTSGDSEHDLKERRGPRPTRREAYRFGTVGVSPWNGVNLDAAYAAQVIGQALPVTSSTRAAYPERGRIVHAVLLDRRL